MDTKTKTTMTIRVNRQTKAAAKKVFDALGLDTTTAINLFLNQVATDQGLPFRPTTTSQIDQATARAEEDVAKGRVTHYKSYEDYRKAMDKL